ncbi:MAG TPA: KEOPS complex subunit Pcc1 [Methanocorpusculum sp.]|nr:KEOPS complex subunit Pcc1 [Methanocorpusculum sp.]
MGKNIIFTHTAKFRFECSYADKLYEILIPESGYDQSGKSEIEISHDDKSVTILIKAEDSSVLRASLNMWLRMVNVCKEIMEL